MPWFNDYQPEMAAIERDGYEIVDRFERDYGHTLGLVIERNGETSHIMLRECFYDTDSEGRRTNFHGVVDIRESRWSRRIRGK